MNNDGMATRYQPAEIENKWYKVWEAGGHFAPAGSGEPYAIMIPPPNVTGTLHMGHAFQDTIMDALIRYQRMNGRRTLWQPGSDHAGIATQMVVERQLNAQGKTRHDLGREAFTAKVWEWKAQSGGQIMQQLRRLGASLDWTRERFTMDDDLSRAVRTLFVRLHEDGLIYRGKRLVNWDPVLKTAISDLEVENREESGFMYHVRYPFVAGQGLDGEYMHIATTRPETILADGALAVHPDDERYRHLLGKMVHVPLTERVIPIIADEYVEMDFGTGCVKITPAHDFNDYAVGQRHTMEVINLMNPDATLNDNVPAAYRGLDRWVAREKIVADLDAAGLLEKVEPHTLKRPYGDRSGVVIEPYLTDQWFVDFTSAKGMEKLTRPAIEAVRGGRIQFVPKNWENTYYNWMENLQDWCISRQLWWGHQIPAWYDNEGNVYVARNQEEAEKQAGKTGLTREEDVLDTWFSSALVPFSTLGWPSETDELKAFLPSNVLVTGYEIIFFWVARMIMMTTHFTGKVPFKDVYIHGIVRDHEGKKMSKSEGNVIDPVDLIDGIDLEKLLVKRTTGLRKPETAPKVEEATKKLFPEGIPSMGADALRFTMASYASLGRSVNFDFKRAEGYRNFCNKIWNATNFVLMNTENQDCGQDETQPLAYTFADQWIIGRLQQTEAAAAEAFETYRFDLAAQTLYEFVWNDYCDWYIELAKVQIQTGCPTTQRTTRRTLVRVLEAALRLLHPIIPFITEELWQAVAPLTNAKTADSIMLAAYPKADPEKIVQAAFDQMAQLQDLIGAVRNLRGEMGIAPNVKAPLFVEGSVPEALLKYLPALTRLTEAKTVDRLPESEDAPVAVCNGARLMLKVEIDKAAETARLSKEAEKLQKALDKLNAKLSKPGYTEKAPAHLVEKDKADLAELEDKMAKVQNQLAKLKD